MATFDEAVLSQLVRDLAQAGDDYSTNYKDLTSLIDNIEQGTMTGPCADELKRLYDDKKGTFEAVANFVENNKSELHQKVNEGVQLLEDLRAGMQ
ncbi:MAG: hypothetical protein IKF71_01165 [Bacilli bacterium]|nr:hypothetical protein [Bacilli bacterium]